MPRLDADKKKLVATVSLEVFRAIRHEAIDRGMTIGQLIEEAFMARVQHVARKAGSRDFSA